MKQIRQGNFELLRILCMLMIVGGHILLSQESMTAVGTRDFYIGNIYRSFAICAVDVFVLISGYFGIHFNIKKILHISYEVLFYCVVILVACVILGIHSINIKKDILLFFPVISQRYWFITIYVLLIIISPLLNIIVNSLSKKIYTFVIIGICVIFYLWPTVCYSVAAPSITKDAGYGIVNFACLYLIGRYIKKYVGETLLQRIPFHIIIVFATLLLFAVNSVMSILLDFYFQQYIAYDSIFCLLVALSLFLCFRNFNIKSVWVNKISKHCLACYIIHAHPVLWSYFWAQDTGRINHNLNGAELIVWLICVPIVIYGVCWGIDVIRTLLTEKIENRLVTWIVNRKPVHAVCEYMDEIERLGGK